MDVVAKWMEEGSGMQLGMATINWTSQFGNDRLDVLDKCAALGADFIEIPFGGVDDLDLPALQDRLQQTGLQAVAGVVLWGPGNLISEEASVRRSTRDYLLRCVDAAAQLGARLATGVIHSPVGTKLPNWAEPRHRQWAAEGVRAMADAAAEHDITLGLEPVNRYENPLINTTRQALDLIETIDRPNVGLHLDTFHGSIEEKSWAEAIRAAGSRLVYVHICENDRGIPGTGLVNWDEIYSTLRDVGFDGGTAMECFMDVHEGMRADASVWRPLAPSIEQLVEQGFGFMRAKAKEYGLLPARVV